MLATTAITLVIGAAVVIGYLKVAPTMPRKHRLRAFALILTSGLVAIAVITTESPLPAVLTTLNLIWTPGPSG